MAKQRSKSSESPASGLLFSEDHTWVRLEGERAYIGLSDYAQRDLGEIIAAELPDVGERIEAGEPFGELESKRTVQELIAPVSGTVTAVNTEIESNPAIINEDPYDEGWLVEVELADEEELDELMGVDEYEEFVAEEDEEEEDEE
ncbi:MAG: glycine cleavage system H protein [Candidatus Binatia bacterium]|nr:MAG: glycine cleavage system H protein [Candidatus Binatia bacterium]